MECEKIDFLAEGPISTGASTEALRAYLCTDLEHIGKGGGDENEIIEVIEVPLENAQEFLREAQIQGALVDFKIFGLIEMAKKTLEKSTSL